MVEVKSKVKIIDVIDIGNTKYINKTGIVLSIFGGIEYEPSKVKIELDETKETIILFLCEVDEV